MLSIIIMFLVIARQYSEFQINVQKTGNREPLITSFLIMFVILTSQPTSTDGYNEEMTPQQQPLVDNNGGF